MCLWRHGAHVSHIHVKTIMVTGLTWRITGNLSLQGFKTQGP